MLEIGDGVRFTAAIDMRWRGEDRQLRLADGAFQRPADSDKLHAPEPGR